MISRIWRVVAALMAVLIVPQAVADEPDRAGVEFFESKIRPMLAAHCYDCHSTQAAANKKLKAGLLLDTRAGVLRGGESGPAIIPGKPEDSRLIAALRHETFEMPPEKKLPKLIVDDFVHWVKIGAPDPRDGKVEYAKETIDIAKAREFWSFQTPLRHNPPPVKNKNWPRDDIDRFVLAEQEKRGLLAVGAAEPHVLVRRLYFDLIGLPPSPEEVEQFAKAIARDRDTAATALVDQLLDSPHFGERWGRHWLDVARYSESNGAPSKNGTWPLTYRYRDYVIDAFNNGKPYDRFVLEQVAGDLLAAEDETNNADLIVATGLLAMGVKNANQRMDEIDDQLDTVGKAVLGLSIGCARCHDHKFDPIPTRDYYALAGILINCVPQDGNGTFTRSRFIGDIDKSEVNKRKDYLQKIGGKESEARKLRTELFDLLHKIPLQYDVADSLEENVKRLEGGEQRKAQERVEKLRKLEGEIETLSKNLRSIECFAAAVKETGVKGKIANVRIHIRGNEDNLGEEVPRGLLTVFPDTQSVTIPDSESGRLQLAQWLAGKQNPLTARVMVNRVWRHLFGRGLVRTTDNFGNTGEPPSHPELLDTLAVDFMEDGWSVKRLIRRIVLSRSYQLGDSYRRDNAQADADNQFLWRHNARKLEAEAVRDAILAASGRLDREPMIGSLIKSFSAFRGAFDIDHETKRSVYMPALRGGTPPLLAAFNFPPASLVVGNRQSTTVPTQALVMMNSDWVAEQADYIALRICTAVDAPSQRADFVWGLIYQRSPTEKEKLRVKQFIDDYQASLTKDQSASFDRDRIERAAWSMVAQSLLGSAEFLWVR